MPIIRSVLELSPHAAEPPEWWPHLPRAVNWNQLIQFYKQDFEKRRIKACHLPWRAPTSSFAFLPEHHAIQLLSPTDFHAEEEAKRKTKEDKKGKNKHRKSTRNTDLLVYGPSCVATTSWRDLLQNFDKLARLRVYDIASTHV